ncbi:hypothetical protein DNU06_08210 [Putridiphycobacter roseus]|uniref:Permuted papain-like amidase YaeF/Yiix C92 family enzyme n=1 Tax=Putridiphycobacter roseus TaxID=2219161 RepID=A0A2W1MZB0_9FLAO|nr:YiiX/YebB-like N1pC/P60 family cysteine hydrolase [Putridiphycobacter roseus]PZE17247.1 hypothetical protein DNU06_08210 [Putridiphycobacter roseus]
MKFILGHIIILLLLSFACTPRQQNKYAPISQSTILELPDTVTTQLKNGDIVLRRGDGPLSYHLSRVNGEPFTHCGIIFKHKNKWGVIHSLGADANPNGIDGVQTTSLASFVKQTADSVLFICRPIFKPNIGDSIVKQAKFYLSEKIPFDHSFSLLDKDKFYCSELLYYTFKAVNQQKNVFKIELKNKSYLLKFSTFFNPKNFKPLFLLKGSINLE